MMNQILRKIYLLNVFVVLVKVSEFGGSNESFIEYRRRGAHSLFGGGKRRKKLFRAHKHILKLVSNVFEAMFRYNDQNAKNKAPSTEQSKAVEIPDVEPQAFQVMLSFSYADDLSELSGDNAMEVLCAAKKYNISGLVDQCLQIPIKNLSNVFMAYVLAHRLDLEAFARQCFSYICQNTGELFGSDEFLQIDQNLLCELIGSDQLAISDELGIWKAVTFNCVSKIDLLFVSVFWHSVGPTKSAVKMAPIVPLQIAEDFSTNIVPSGVLTMEEVVGIYQFHCHPNLRAPVGLYPLKFASIGRISAKRNRETPAGGTEFQNDLAKIKKSLFDGYYPAHELLMPRNFPVHF
ncbi:hypothetical protein niasHS_012552 [Heterodera schachtii]|uniref:BTB domain-containing protein n=1 Tax=Heterodera schachtii TaxID=97005 RepID=A0ABD2ICL4_HETSC